MDYYIGLGDSVSISSYPSLSAGRGTKAKIGAIDLTGKELIKLGLVREHINHAEDGACMPAVYEQARAIPKHISRAANIISLTIGGNDISFAAMEKRLAYEEYIVRIKNEHTVLIAWLLKEFPNSVLLVNNSYDVTDGKGELPDCGSWTPIVKEYSRGRRELGDYIRTVYGSEIHWERIIFHDLFKHFDGKGMASGTVYTNGWYYKDFLIEPGHVGAQEIAGLWVQSVISLNKASMYHLQPSLRRDGARTATDRPSNRRVCGRSPLIPYLEVGTGADGIHEIQPPRIYQLNEIQPEKEDGRNQDDQDRTHAREVPRPRHQDSGGRIAWQARR